MRKRSLHLAIILVLCTSAALAKDSVGIIGRPITDGDGNVGLMVFGPNFLQPEDSGYAFGAGYLDEKDALIMRLLAASYAEDVTLRLIATPKVGTTEWATGLIRRADEFYIFGLRPEISMGNYTWLEFLRGEVTSEEDEEQRHFWEEAIATQDAYLPDDPMTVPVNRCETAIGPQLAARITEVWEKMLLGTRYEPRNFINFHGTVFHFSMFSEEIGGQIAGQADAPRGNNPARLAAIGTTMFEFCQTGDAAFVENLSTQVDDLRARLE